MTESERCTDPIKAPWIPKHREVQLPRRIRNCMQIHWAVQSFEGSDGRVPKHPNGPKVDPTGPKEPFETQITGVLENDTRLQTSETPKRTKTHLKSRSNHFWYADHFGEFAPNNALSTSKQLSTINFKTKHEKKNLQFRQVFCNSQLKKTPNLLRCHTQMSPNWTTIWAVRAGACWSSFRLWRVYEKKTWGRGIYTLVN